MIQTTHQKRATMRSLSSFHPLPEQLVLSVESGRLYSTASGLGCIEDGIPSAPCALCNVAAETTAATNHADSRRQPATNMPPKTRPLFCVSFSSSSSFSFSFSYSYFSSFFYSFSSSSIHVDAWMGG